MQRRPLILPAYVFTWLLLLLSLESCKKDALIQPTPAAEPDTTSHNFLWQVDTLGGWDDSYLKDVAFVGPSLAYAVGKVYTRDTTNPAWPYYMQNAARWDGQHWELLRVQASFRGNITTSANGGVFYSPDVGLWVAGEGVAFKQLPNEGWWTYDYRQITNHDSLLATCVWENPSIKTVYFGGLGGTLLRFDGAMWQSFETGTREAVQDIWGGSHPVWGTDAVVALISAKYTLPDTRFAILQRDGTVKTVPFDDPHKSLYSLWYSPSTQRVYACGDGFFTKGPGENAWTQPKDAPNTYYLNKVRGNSDNDLFVVGDYGFVAHYNGRSWHTYPELRLNDGKYHSIAVNGDQVLIVGENFYPGTYDAKAVAVYGRRIPYERVHHESQ